MVAISIERNVESPKERIAPPGWWATAHFGICPAVRNNFYVPAPFIDRRHRRTPETRAAERQHDHAGQSDGERDNQQLTTSKWHVSPLSFFGTGGTSTKNFADDICSRQNTHQRRLHQTTSK